MADYTEIDVPDDSEADFAIRVTDTALSPRVRKGQTVTVRRSCELTDGDVGIFFLDGELSFYQYCEDHLGNVYLLSVNRRYRSRDRMLSREEGAELVCYGRVLLDPPVPLPDN